MSDNPPYEQAKRIILKFGGVKRLSQALTAVGCPKSEQTVREWTRSRDRTQDLTRQHNSITYGLIPAKVWPFIFAAARYEGIILTSRDIDPRVSIEDAKKPYFNATPDFRD